MDNVIHGQGGAGANSDLRREGKPHRQNAPNR
jgi:hypothetical protein